MSVSSISQSDFVADVLHIIFQQLEGKDLVNCEAVCRQWRDILFAGTPWRKLFLRQVDCSLLWRKEQKKLEKNQLILHTEQYRDICRNLLQVERSWRIGKFTKSVCSLNAVTNDITIIDDYVAWAFDYLIIGEHHGRCSFLETESMKIAQCPRLVCMTF
jgi:F-box-like